jgi:hypothetical protein
VTAKATNTNSSAVPVERSEMIVSFVLRLERSKFSMADPVPGTSIEAAAAALLAETQIPAGKIYD